MGCGESKGAEPLPSRFAASAAASAATTGTTAAATTTAAGSAASTKTAAAAEAALRLGTGFVHVQRAAVQSISVERGDRLVRLALVFHFDECETAGTPGFTIGHNPC